LPQGGARGKQVKDFERYRKVRPILLEHRMAVETEIRNSMAQKKYPPHILMNKIL
jgi:hypothetical protein